MIYFKSIFFGEFSEPDSVGNETSRSSVAPPISFNMYKPVELPLLAAYSNNFFAISISLSKPNPFLYI